MADSKPDRKEFQNIVQQQITLSLGLSLNQKNSLIGQLPSLSEDQLKKLQLVFAEENKRKETILHEFFSKNPKLYPDFARLSNDHVNAIFREVESGEKAEENNRLEEILKTDY